MYSHFRQVGNEGKGNILCGKTGLSKRDHNQEKKIRRVNNEAGYGHSAFVLNLLLGNLPVSNFPSEIRTCSNGKTKNVTTATHTLTTAGIARRLERPTRDQKVPGSSPRRSGGRIFFSRVNFLF